MSVAEVIVLQNSQNALRSISRKLTKRAAIADRCRLQAIAEAACEFIADYVVPQMIIRSQRVQPGKLLLVDTKRLLQHYRRHSGHDRTCYWLDPVANDPERTFDLCGPLRR